MYSFSFDEEKKYLIIKDCALFNTLKDETEENILEVERAIDEIIK